MLPILATKLSIPPLRPQVVNRPRLLNRLNEGLRHRLTLISASAGFGKTTLICQWLKHVERPVACLSLDKEDNDPIRFLTALAATLQTIAPSLCEETLRALQSPQPPPLNAILITLLNDLTAIQDPLVLVLDDYHIIDNEAVNQILTSLITHLPPSMHLVITTREDPHIPLARLRAQDQLTELRVGDLRFTPSEAITFLTQIMGLALSTQNAALLANRTEGWITGLQLAALSLRGHDDVAGFIASFTGSHHFVLDYLVEEVLTHQPQHIQTFLLRTSILERLCGPLCDAVICDASINGQTALQELERANLFIIPLDNERYWYRYHHLFADLLRQRLRQQNEQCQERELHIRASTWFEDQGHLLEAFHHAVAANDIERTTHLVEGNGMPLHFRGALIPVLRWLESLSATTLDTWPSLWVMYASALSMAGQLNKVEEKLQAAETVLHGMVQDDWARNLIGHIAAIRALVAATQYQEETIIVQSRRALEYLHPNNLAIRTATIWKLGWAYQMQGDRVAAEQAYTETISLCRESGNLMIHISATVGLGAIQEANNQLHQAVQTYQHALQLAGGQPQLVLCEAHLGLARIFYEWNELDTAQYHGHQSLQLAQPYESVIDRFIVSETFLARLSLASNDIADATTRLAQAEQSARRRNSVARLPEIAAVQILLLLQQGDLTTAAHLAHMHNLPISQARVYLAHGDTSAALAVLEPWQQQAEARKWEDECLRGMVLQAVALFLHGARNRAIHLLRKTLAIAEPAGFIRLFADEGAIMAHLLSEGIASGIASDYIRIVRPLCGAEKQQDTQNLPSAQSLLKPLSQRELEVLQLMALGHSNQEICKQLFLALDTVKGHNRKIFGKLQVQRRTEAVARARELGLL